MDGYNPKIIESKWQSRWEQERVFQPRVDEGREKFFLTVPYPYLNGNLHAGHTRTYTIGDVIARYRRMAGFNVLFPMAFHVTGTPIVGLAELIQQRDPQTIRVYSELQGIPRDVLLGLDTPEKIVEYFKREAEADMRSAGFSIDWRRKFTTTDPHYKRFITWQFNLLREKGLVERGVHPVRWCPNDQNPVEDHDLLRGESASIVDYTLIKFRFKEGVLPCATLRPETVFGVTNLWVNPGVKYQRVRVDGETWIVSPTALEKLKYTDKEVTPLSEIEGRSLVGETAENPVTGNKVPVLPAGFVDPENGSGIVMSVPAHAPYDYLALRDLGKLDEIKPISLIKVPGYGEFPAIEAVEELGVKDQHDPRAEEATKLVYRREFHSGELNDITGKYAGTKVSKIKDILTQDLLEEGKAEVFYEFSEQPVICRCGTRCVVKLVRDQWFLTYSKPEWKNRVYQCLAEMQIIPPELRLEFENKVDWLRDKACARRKGLGTPLPWDPQWLIESLGDSTIYMAYYTLAKFIARLKPENLTKEFLDHVLLGEGEVEYAARASGVSVELLEEIRREFLYWYPVDLRSSGKDLIPNHLLFFLFHHTAIFPRELWPRAIAINGFVSLEGQKMSKSRGPILTLKASIEKYGADTTRLYILSNAELVQDADWRDTGVQATRRQLERFHKLTLEALETQQKRGGEAEDTQESESQIDRWLQSRLQRRVKETRDALETVQTRKALQSAFYLLQQDVKWYQRRGGTKLTGLLETWIRLLAPFTPHLAEELWQKLGKQGFVSLAPYPQYQEDLIDPEVEAAEDLIQKTLEDIEEITRLTRVKPARIHIYTAPAWKREILKIALELQQKGELETRNLMKQIFQKPEVSKSKKEAQKYAQKLLEQLKTETPADLDETEILQEAQGFLEKELNCQIEITSADKPGYDPKNKSREAIPGRPAIYIEGG